MTISADKISEIEIKQIKWLLRRIEHDVQRDEAATLIVSMLQTEKISTLDLFVIIDNDIFYKSRTLNSIAVNCYANGLYEHVIPFLQKSLNIEPSNEDTLYNLGTVLFQFQLYSESLNFLQQIQEPDQEILELIKEAEEKAYEPQKN